MARLWVDLGRRLGMGVSVVSQGPIPRLPSGWELGVSWYGGRGLLCSPWDLHPFLYLHLFPTLSLPSPSALVILLETQKRVEYGPMGLTFGADWVRTMRRQSHRPIAFGRVWNFDQFQCRFGFDAAFSTGILKSCKYLYILLTYISVFPSLQFEKFQSVSHAIPPFHFRVADITFYIKNLHCFETQLMETTKLIPTVNKRDSHNIRQKS